MKLDHCKPHKILLKKLFSLTDRYSNILNKAAMVDNLKTITLHTRHEVSESKPKET